MKIKIILPGLLLVIAFFMLTGCQGRLTTVVTHIPVEQQKDYTRQLPPGELALRKITDIWGLRPRRV